MFGGIGAGSGMSLCDVECAADGTLGKFKAFYRAENVGEVALENCTLVDSNGQLMPMAPGNIAVTKKNDQTLSNQSCSTKYQIGEPGTDRNGGQR